MEESFSLDKHLKISIPNRIRELIDEIYIICTNHPTWWLDEKFWTRLRWLKINEERLEELD